MKKNKVLASVFTTIISIASFAASPKGRNNDFVTDVTQPVQQVPVDTSPDLLTIVLYALVALVILGGIGYIVWVLYNKFSAHFEALTDLKELFNRYELFFQKQIVPQDKTVTLQSQIASLQRQMQNSVSNSAGNGVTQSYIADTANQLYDAFEKSIDSKITPISSSLDSTDIKVALERYSNQTKEIEEKIKSLLSLEPSLREMNEQMQKLIGEKPELVNLSINNSVELLKQCNTEGISSIEQIKEMHKITEQYKIAQFSSLAELSECKNYYDARSSHIAAQKESSKQISELQTEKTALNHELNSLQQKQMSIAEESVRLKQANENLQTKKSELENNLSTLNAEKDRLTQILGSLCPKTIDVDSLFVLLKNSTAELRAETLALIVQLYWFAQISRNTPSKIKAAFTKFDETLYEIFSEKQELLQSIRQSIQEVINSEVFKDTAYEISWPMLNSSASEHEDYYNRENDEGNRICKVRSAVILNAGNVESVARIYTSL